MYDIYISVHKYLVFSYDTFAWINLLEISKKTELVRVCIKHCCPILIFVTLPKFPIDTLYQVYLSLHFESHQIFLKSGLKICLENQS